MTSPPLSDAFLKDLGVTPGHDHDELDEHNDDDDTSSTTSEEQRLADVFFNLAEEMPPAASDQLLFSSEQAMIADVGPQEASSLLQHPVESAFLRNNNNTTTNETDRLRDVESDSRRPDTPDMQETTDKVTSLPSSSSVRPAWQQETKSLAQLVKNSLGPITQQKDQTPEIPFEMKDADQSVNELDEFVMFSEKERLQETQSAFDTAFDAYCGQYLGWLNATHTQQCAYVRHLKTLLEHPSGNGDEKEGLEEQRNAIHQLHYITYGTWGDVDSIDMLQVQIVKNLSPLFEAEVWPVLYRLFIHEVNLFMTRSELGALPHALTISSIMSIFYAMLEYGRNEHRSLLLELLDQSIPSPLPFLLMLLPQLSALAVNASVPSFPLKKLLCLTWKVALIQLGGREEIKTAKETSRKHWGLSPSAPPNQLKISPSSYLQLHHSIMSQYPFYIPDKKASPYYDHLLQLDALIDDLLPPNERAKETPLPHTVPLHRATTEQTELGKWQAETIHLANKHLYIPKRLLELGHTYQHYKSKTSSDLLKGPDWSDTWQHRFKSIFTAIEGHLQSIIVTLLKLLLATVTAPVPTKVGTVSASLRSYGSNKSNDSPRKGGSEEGRSGPAVQLLRNDLDVCAPSESTKASRDASCFAPLPLPSLPLSPGVDRSSNSFEPSTFQVAQLALEFQKHREVCAKAIIAILVTLLKASKASHTLFADKLAQQLVDANALTLLLKLLNVEPTQWRMSGGEIDEMKFSVYSTAPLQTSNTAVIASVARAIDRTTPPITLGRPFGSPNAFEINPLAVPSPGRPGSERSGEKVTPSRLAQESPTSCYIDNPASLSAKGTPFRPMYCLMQYLNLLQMLTGHRTHRLTLMAQLRAANVLKRVLRVNNADVQRRCVKILKGVVREGQANAGGPGGLGIAEGRKWRIANMKVVSTVFLRLRPGLREEWLQSMFPTAPGANPTSIQQLAGYMNKEQAEAEEALIRHLTTYFLQHDCLASTSHSTMDVDTLYQSLAVEAKRDDFDGMPESWRHRLIQLYQ